MGLFIMYPHQQVRNSDQNPERYIVIGLQIVIPVALDDLFQ